MFFGQSFLEWIYGNLCEQGETVDGLWSTTFALAAWWSWKLRCKIFFEKIEFDGIESVFSNTWLKKFVKRMRNVDRVAGVLVNWKE